jgi:hypothetical protein
MQWEHVSTMYNFLLLKLVVRKITAMHQKVKSERKGVIATYRQVSFNRRFHPM